MKKGNHTIIQIFVVIMVLGVFTLVMLGSTSYAFKDHTEDYLDEIKHVILKEAKIYGKTLNSLKEEGSLIITLNDLIDAGYYVPDDNEGDVVDPRNSKATLNSLKIKLVYQEDGNIDAEIIEEE